MEYRQQIKKLYKQRDSINSEIQSLTVDYVSELKDDKGIFISDHCIVRYLERVKGFTFDAHLSDTDKVLRHPIPPEDIRSEMLSIEEDRKILNSRLSFLYRDGYGYIIKELALVTVIIL